MTHFLVPMRRTPDYDTCCICSYTQPKNPGVDARLMAVWVCPASQRRIPATIQRCDVLTAPFGPFHHWE